MNNEANETMANIIAVAFAGAIALAAVTGIVWLGIIIGRKFGGDAERKTRVLCLVPTVISILISLVGFVTNFGWGRFGMTFMLLPVWYPLLLVVSSSASASVIKKSASVRIIYVLSHVLYVLSGLAMPDGGDTGPSYVFFGLIKGDTSSMELPAIAMFIHALVLMIVQIIIARDHRKALEKK